MEMLPEVLAAPDASLTWLGVDEGAGETTMAGWFPGSVAAGHAWPTIMPEGAISDVPIPVVLVARLNDTSLGRAAIAARQWAAGTLANVQLLGIVFIPAAKRRPSRSIRDQARIVAGGVPRAWHMPFVTKLERDPALTRDSLPPVALKVLADLETLTNRK